MPFWKLVTFCFTLLAFLHCGSTQNKEEIRFSYQNVYKDRYENGTGGIIPLTLERGESFGGTITQDGQYLLFTGNKYGNYDIFMRPLSEVESAPITRVATNQREPAISPDGKR
ncbi:MAG: PD40 domain-containing protein, partial [Leptospiraceae bacterium]|nr:PD40 domain-containing protein [Leptospiraceae bacterium]